MYRGEYNFLFLTLLLRWTDLGCEVYVGSSVQQQLGHAHVLIVGRDVERCETSLQRKGRDGRGECKDKVYLYHN